MEILIYHSKTNLDEKILFGNIPNLIDPEIRKMLVKVMLGNNFSHSILVHDLPSIEIRVYYFSNWQHKLQCHINHWPE